MYYLLGLEENIKNIYLLSKNETLRIYDEEGLKRAYLAFLKQRQPDIWHPSEKDALFQTAIPIIQGYINEYCGKDAITDIDAVINIPKKESMLLAWNEIKKAITYLHEFDENLFFLFKLAINTLFYAISNEQGGGSISSAIGVIWCANKKNWSLNDNAEFLIHEMTHNLVFLDELRFGHYHSYDEISKKENYALSAILKRPRPIDKVFHSLIVGTEILMYRSKNQEALKIAFHKVHPTSEELYLNCCLTLRSLLHLMDSNPHLVLPRFSYLLEKVNEKLMQFLF